MANEPELSPLPESLRASLSAAKGAGPSAAARDRIHARVLRRAGGGGGGAPRWALATGAALVVAIAIGWSLWPAPVAPPDLRPEVVPVAAPTPAPVARPSEPGASDLVESAEDVHAVADVETEPTSAEVPTEMELLDAAHGALPTRPARALRYLTRHRALYPDGVFEEEREVLAIEALMILDRDAEARARAERYLAAHPTTAHRRRVEELLAP